MPIGSKKPVSLLAVLPPATFLALFMMWSNSPECEVDVGMFICRILSRESTVTGPLNRGT